MSAAVDVMARLDTGDFDPASPIAPQIGRNLRTRIIRCDLKPGDRISEADVSRAYSVSRQPVREAFIKLAEQGLLTIRPQRGTTVARIAYSSVLDARFMREAIEADIVAILVRAPTPGLIGALEAEIAAQRAVDPADAVSFTRLDERFHRLLADAAGTAGAWRLLEGLKAQMDRVRYLSLGQFPAPKLIEQHAALVERIAAGDAVGADTAIRVHLREVLRDLPHVRDANPDFFDMPAGTNPTPVNAPIRGGTTP
jgi:DNA-binding GntR family transcriptional regulator